MGAVTVRRSIANRGIRGARGIHGTRKTSSSDVSSVDVSPVAPVAAAVAADASSAAGERYARGTRSYTMSHIHGKDTSIEVLVRRYLFSRGLRFRKNDERYPGHPDVVLPKWHVIVFVNGCFWHMHQGCAKRVMPKSHVEFWTTKLLRNRKRDRRQHAQLRASGWRVIDVWECELTRSRRQERLRRLVEQITGDEIGSGSTAPADAECVNVEPNRVASARVEPGRAQPGCAERGRVESTDFGSGRAESVDSESAGLNSAVLSPAGH